MAKTFTQVPPDSTGDKLRMRSLVEGADTLHDQGVFIAGLPTYLLVADAVVFAANKHHISIFNNAGSAQTICLLSLKFVNLAVSGVVGVPLRFDIRKTTAQSVGTAITPVFLDTRNPALAGIQYATGATITNGALIKPIIRQTDEQLALTTNVLPLIEELNLLEINDSGQAYSLRPGEGMTVQQITSSVIGSYAWMMKFTVEPD